MEIGLGVSGTGLRSSAAEWRRSCSWLGWDASICKAEPQDGSEEKTRRKSER